MTRGGRKTDRDMPERKCIATGVNGPKAGMIRFVVGPGDMIVPDLAAKLPGRGIYVSADRPALERAAAKGLFSRAARTNVQVATDLVEQIEGLLVKRVVDLISLSRKSGSAIAGFEKVKESVVAGDARLLLQACDGSPAQLAKIRPPIGENTHITCLFGHELGLAFGRENVIHAALAAGGLAQRVVEDAARLAGLRKGKAL